MRTFPKTEFYFSAHADDWQLFMDPQIGHAIADKTCKVVIVHTTAGDAGREERYWKARELAALESVLFRLSMDESVEKGAEEWREPNGRVHRVSLLNNCSCYFMRLPDGDYSGKGFQLYDNQSLDKLRMGSIPSITAVDGSSAYTGWKDLVSSIDAIVDHEAAVNRESDAVDIRLNIPEDDKELNPFDHNDHLNTSLLVKATQAYNRCRKRSFLTYCLRDSKRLLSGNELFWKIGIFSAYQQSLFREYGHSTLLEDDAFIPWCFSDSSWRDL